MTGFDPKPCVPAGTQQVIACLDLGASTLDVARAAADFAELLGVQLILYHGIETSALPQFPSDPLEWQLMRVKARKHLEGVQTAVSKPQLSCAVQIGEGNWRKAIFGDNGGNPASLVVIGSSRQRRTGVLARSLLEAGANHVLIVSPGSRGLRSSNPCIAIPIDGSRFAEAALAEATTIARIFAAELLLIHVTPPALVEKFGPAVGFDNDLQRQLDQRNERLACSFLDKTVQRLRNLDFKVRSRCVKGDPRTSLEFVLAEESPALVVFSARGQGFYSCSQLSLGSTASYLLDRLAAPLILVASGVGDHQSLVPIRETSRSRDHAEGPAATSPIAA